MRQYNIYRVRAPTFRGHTTVRVAHLPLIGINCFDLAWRAPQPITATEQSITDTKSFVQTHAIGHKHGRNDDDAKTKNAQPYFPRPRSQKLCQRTRPSPQATGPLHFRNPFPAPCRSHLAKTTAGAPPRQYLRASTLQTPFRSRPTASAPEYANTS